jgi:acyl carrier protein
MEEIHDKLIRLIFDNMSEDNRNMKTIESNDRLLADLNFSSIGIIGLFLSLEEEFNISIIDSEDNNKYFSIITVKDLEDVLLEELKGN